MGQEGAVHGLGGDEVHVLPGQEVQPVAVGLVVGHLELAAAGAEADHGLEHVPLTLLDVLAHGVEVGGELHAGGEQALVLLPLALAVELLPPLGEEPEPGLVARQDLDLLPLGVEVGAGGGVLPGGVGRKVRLPAGLHHIGGAGHELLQVHSGHGDGQQAHGGEDAVAAAHIVGHHESLVALGVGQGLQGSPGLVGGGVDPLGGLRLAVLLLQHGLEETEGHGGLGGGAGLGDDVDGEILVPQQVHDLLEAVAGQAVAGKIDVWGIPLEQVVVVGAQQLNGRPGPQVAAADADDHQGPAVGLDLLRRRLNPGELLLVVVPGQVHPAHEVAAPSGGLLEPGVGLGQSIGVGGGVDRRAGKINVEHGTYPP